MSTRLAERVAERSTILRTPCGDGSLVWHRWGAGPPLLLLHGGYGSWTHWVRTIDALAQRYDVLAADLPGLGDSAEPRGPVTAEGLAAIVADGLDRILPDRTACHVVGFSFGATISGPLAVHGPTRLRSLVLVGPGGLGRLRPPIPLRSWRHEPEDAQPAIHRANLAALMFADPERIDDEAVELQAANAARGRVQSRPISGNPVLAEALPEVRAPVAAIFGERDATLWPHLEQRRAQLMELVPRIDFVSIADAGHWVMYEAADAFNSELLGMLGRLEADVDEN